MQEREQEGSIGSEDLSWQRKKHVTETENKKQENMMQVLKIKKEYERKRRRIRNIKSTINKGYNDIKIGIDDKI